MSSKYKTINRITKPLSMYRYPNKKWKHYIENCPQRLREKSIVQQTFQFGETTVDFKFFKGEEKDFQSYLDKVFNEFNFDDDKIFDDFLCNQTEESFHYTVICHSCEKWGNIHTKKYVEIFPTEYFHQQRLKRPTLFGYFNEGSFVFINGKSIPQSEREPNTDTPTMFLLGESYRNKTKTNMRTPSEDPIGMFDLSQIPTHLIMKEIGRRTEKCPT